MIDNTKALYKDNNHNHNDDDTKTQVSKLLLLLLLFITRWAKERLFKNVTTYLATE